MNTPDDDPVLAGLSRLNPVVNQPKRPDILASVLDQIRDGRTAADGRPLRAGLQPRWPLAVAAAVIVLSVSTWAVVRNHKDAAPGMAAVTTSSNAGSDPSIFSAPQSASDPKYIAAVRAVTPLVGAEMICGGVTVPVGVLAMPANDEGATSPFSATIRQFVQDDPWHLPDITAGGWLALSASEQGLVVGRRTGPMGIGTVVVFVKRNGSFVADHTDGCTSYFGDGQVAERIEEVKVEGSQATIAWVSGTCGPGGHPYSVSKVEQVSTNHSTHLLLLTTPDPSSTCPLNASIARTTIRMDSSYEAGNAIYDDSVVPSQKES